MIKYYTQDHYHKKAIRPVCGVLIALDGILVWLERKFCYCMSYLRANRTDMECAIFLVNLDSHDQLVSPMRDNYAGGAKQMMGQMLLRYKFLKLYLSRLMDFNFYALKTIVCYILLLLYRYAFASHGSFAT